MDVGALSFGTPLARTGQTGRSAAADAARPATGANEQSAGNQPPVSAVTAQPSGLYISPVLRYDQSARVAVLLFRDFDTGETRDQIPAERVVEQYRRSGGPPQVFGEPQGAQAARPGGVGGGEAGTRSGYSGDGSSGDGSPGGGAAGSGAAGAPSLGESYLAAIGGPSSGGPSSGGQGAAANPPSGGPSGTSTSGTSTSGTLVSFSV